MMAVYQFVEANARWIAILVLLVLLAWESFQPFFGFFRKRVRVRAAHALRNFALGVLNSFVIASLFVALWLWAAETAADRQFGILYWLNAPPWLHAVGSVLLLDLWTYWWHRINHEWPFLWRFHRVHHSDHQMDVTTSNRFHLGEIVLSSALRVPLILLFGAKLWHVALYELLMFPVVQFHHANVGLRPAVDRLLRIFIVTPSMHKVHHSRLPPETDSNYTSLLSIWDRVFRTFRLRDDPRTIEFGLEGYDEPRKQSVAGMLKTPLDKTGKD